MITEIHLDHPVRVGIDGIDTSGKTMLADKLVAPLEARGRRVIRVSIDGFHNPKVTRHRQGRSSPRGYYEDSFNHKAILSCILLPLAASGNLRYRSAQFDFRTDSPATTPWQEAAPDSVLLFDGVFLHRPELRPYWDFSIFVHTDFEVAVQRAGLRDQYLFGTPNEVAQIYKQRYVPGQKIYLEAKRAFEKANVVVDNNDIRNPELKVNRPTLGGLLQQPNCLSSISG